MSPRLTHRQRVVAALQHQEPDRVPLDLMGNASMLLDDTYLRLRDYLGLAPIPPVRSGSSANYYDERILERLDIDFRRVFLKRKLAAAVDLGDDTFIDGWRVRYKRAGIFVNAVEHPLAGATTLEQIAAYPWPKAEELFSAEGLYEEARCLYHETDYALVARNPLSEGFLDRGCQLMGMPDFLMAMALHPEVASELVASLIEIYKGTYRLFLEAVGPYVQMVEVADDLGTQQSLLISPAMYRRFIKPAEKQLYAVVHALAPEAAIFHHSDGAIFDIIPDMIEVGVNVLNPVQASARGMDPRRLKEAYGSRLSFHGGISGFEDDVDAQALEQEVRDRIDAFGPGGGYVLAPCNHMVNVHPQNVLLVFDTAKSYGTYAARRMAP